MLPFEAVGQDVADGVAVPLTPGPAVTISINGGFVLQPVASVTTIV
jgi:hypothetical protein